jgi:hypothetical protein
MLNALVLGIAAASVMLVSCVKPQSEKNVGSAQITSSATKMINPAAFNAFLLWKDGGSSEILEYPADYDGERITDPDGVFYVLKSEYYDESDFIGSPTKGVVVQANVLTYPARQNRQLVLRFSNIAPNPMHHKAAMTYCRDSGLRLPTARELFDYCTAANNSACANRLLWSASLDRRDTFYSLQVDGSKQQVNFAFRKDCAQFPDLCKTKNVVCVGR